MSRMLQMLARAHTAIPTSGGEPLEPAIQARMERSFRHDFSAVRIHQGRTAIDLGALAFASGYNIHFAPGHYDPQSAKGQELLGHELAHVVQQASGRVPPTVQSKGMSINDDGSLEREADEAGSRAARGEVADIPSGGRTCSAVVQGVFVHGKDRVEVDPDFLDWLEHRIPESRRQDFQTLRGPGATWDLDVSLPLLKGPAYEKGDSYEALYAEFQAETSTGGGETADGKRGKRRPWAEEKRMRDEGPAREKTKEKRKGPEKAKETRFLDRPGRWTSLRSMLGRRASSAGSKQTSDADHGRQLFENGSFLVVGPAEAPGVSWETYRKLYRCMIGCTFPITGSLQVQESLCPGYVPHEADHILVKTFGSAGYRFLFLPRHLHMLLYYLFVERAADRTITLDRIDYEDSKILAGAEKHFISLIEDQLMTEATMRHLGHFNAWALRFLSLPRRRLLNTMVLRSNTINTLEENDITRILECAFNYNPTSNKDRKNPAANAILDTKNFQRALTTIVLCELVHHECMFLTRRDLSFEPLCLTSSDDAQSPFSNSFAPDIFASVFGELHACTMLTMDDNATVFLTPIKIHEYKQRRGVARFFWIQPYPSLCLFYMGMSELWHPRSRIFKIEGQAIHSIGGMEDNAADNYIRRGASILDYDAELNPEELITYNDEFENYIADHSIVIMKNHALMHCLETGRIIEGMRKKITVVLQRHYIPWMQQKMGRRPDPKLDLDLIDFVINNLATTEGKPSWSIWGRVNKLLEIWYSSH